MRSPDRPLNLSDDVKELLDQGQEKEAAIRLKAEQPWLDNKAIMRAFFNYKIKDRKTGFYLQKTETGTANSEPRETWTIPYTIINLGAFLAFIWAMINIFVLISSLIILANIDGYRKENFQIVSSYYTPDSEAGDSWGVRGLINGQEIRFSDPTMLPDDDSVNPARYIRQNYPADSITPVLFNPDVTDDLFQRRTVNVILWSEDPAAEEQRRIKQWMINCISPFLFFVFASWLMRKTTQTIVIK